MKIAFIPIDNRPVCYSLAEQISKIDRGLELLLPPREMLGDLTKIADVEGLFNWLKDIPKVDRIILSLDTVAHGGLIPSRRSTDSLETIKNRVKNLEKILSEKDAKIYAFSSIMRISNNNINEEEKEYWNLYGEKIFRYSFECHKNAPNKVNCEDVPDEIIQDYLTTRKRNFEINKYYLQLAEKGFFETLVFSKDDCAKYGFNVAEAESLKAEILQKKLKNVLIKTGADEIPLSLLSRSLTDGKELKIAPVFTEPDYTNKISKYEDVSVFESVKGQIELAGATVCEKESADIILLVNNFKEEQGELVMGVDVDLFEGDMELPQKPYLVADIRNANGADNHFVEKLFKQKFGENFLGYAGWNTTGNTLGSGLCCGIVKLFAKKENLDSEAFKKVQTIRFLDDWAYQANVRKKLKSYLAEVCESELKKEMIAFEKTIQEKFKTTFKTIKYSYPWNRFFEIEVLL